MARRRARPPVKGSFRALAQRNQNAIAAANPTDQFGFSMDDLAAQAAAMARAQIASQQKALQQQLATLNQQGERRSNVATGAYAGLSRLLGSIGPQIRDTYQQAADAQQQAGQGFSDTYRAMADQNAAADQAFLTNMGQQATPTQTSGADALYGLGGYVPSTSLGREGAAWSAYGSTLPSSANRTGQMEVADILRTNTEQAGPINAELASLNASVPGIRAQILNDLFGQRLQAWQAQDQSKLNWAAFNLSKEELTAKTKTAKLTAAEQAKQDRYDLMVDAGYDPFTGEKTVEEKKLSVSFSKENGYYTYVDGTPKLDAKGKKIPYGRGGRGGVEKLTRDEWSSINSSVSRAASSLANDTTSTEVEDYPGYPEAGTHSVDKQKYTRQQAYKLLWDQFSLEVPKKNKVANQRLRRIINQMLTNAGYGKPGAPGLGY